MLTNNDDAEDTETNLIPVEDCAVCLQKCHHPTQLPCGHVFCFLCVKGVAIQSRKCAMCRAPIPRDYLDHPVLLEKIITSAGSIDVEYQWYYKGGNGWWKYDEISNEELEKAHSDGLSECTLLLAGTLYCIDFQTMVQRRKNDPSRRRNVKRDAPTLPSKGIAGIKIIEEQKSQTELSPSVIVTDSEGPSEESEQQNENSMDSITEIVQNLEIVTLDSSTLDQEET